MRQKKPLRRELIAVRKITRWVKRLPSVHKKIGHETNSGNTAAGAVVREGEGEVAKSKFRECRRSSGSAGPSLDALFCLRLNRSQRSITAV